jgi:arylsulfatase A-like enzyme
MHRWTVRPARPGRHPRRPPAGLATLAAAAVLLGGAAAGAADRPPNVIVILIDDQGYGDLSCHGNPILETPHLDALAADAVRLTDYHASPFCSPTRASILTGRLCRSVGVHGLNGIGQHMAVEPRTMAELYAAAGYVTGIFGKWHLGDRWPLRPMDRGFAESVVFPDGAVSTVPDHWGNDYVDDTYLENGRPRAFKGYCTDVWFDLAIDFIERHRERPFLCYLPTNAPHAPWIAPEKFVAAYRGRVPDDTARFFGMIANLDGNIGRLRSRLVDLGLDRDTIVVFTTDNGTALGSGVFAAGMRGRKGSSFDGGHRVPCFVRYPAGGIAGGRDVAALTAHIDLLPTLLDLCGVAGGDARPAFDGTSLARVLAGTADPPADRLLVESYHHIALTERWRLVDEEQLYDIEADPTQQRDVAAEHPDVVRRLKEAVAAARQAEDTRPHHVTVGGGAQDPVTLTGEDWPTKPAIFQYEMARITPWDESQVWPVAVHRPGRYRVALRRWPRETATAINAALPRGTWCRAMQACTSINATQAHLRLGDRTEAVAVTDDMEEAVFTLDLPAGPTELRGWFTGATPERWAARYVEVSRLPDPP